VVALTKGVSQIIREENDFAGCMENLQKASSPEFVSSIEELLKTSS
jgi:hypothetical protein|tara:strand:+ start:1731 stop:1868 length:138 start_codon:yes stop_codon:yes gene_type:complete